MLKAYKVEIKPTAEQASTIDKTIGVCRFVYNLYITKNKEIYESDKKFISGFTFSKWLNNEYVVERPEMSWIKDVSSKAVKQAIMNAESAFKKFFKKKAKFPRYKKKTDKIGMYLPRNSKTDFLAERHRVKIPILKYVRLKEYGYVPNCQISSCAITRDAGKYFISFLADENTSQQNYHKTSEGIGIDLGIKEFAVTSSGRFFKNINKTVKVKKLNKSLKRQQRAFGRKLNILKRTAKAQKKPSRKNLDKNLLKIQKLNYRLRNIKKEYVKFVVNSLVKANNLPAFISIEDLNVKGMMKNRHLSKAVQNQNFYYFRQYLIQKCNKFGVEVRLIDRWFPSSKTCNKCGCVKESLKLSERTFKCDDCGNTDDRDLNASKNIRDCSTYEIATNTGGFSGNQRLRSAKQTEVAVSKTAKRGTLKQ